MVNGVSDLCRTCWENRRDDLDSFEARDLEIHFECVGPSTRFHVVSFLLNLCSSSLHFSPQCNRDFSLQSTPELMS